uniref:Uncharacterized protein n=1 Tax=Cacopsylla melanoneura TaxID=428564 RepID=A0A8D9AFG3_9HEMI
MSDLAFLYRYPFTLTDLTMLVRFVTMSLIRTCGTTGSSSSSSLISMSSLVILSLKSYSSSLRSFFLRMNSWKYFVLFITRRTCFFTNRMMAFLASWYAKSNEFRSGEEMLYLAFRSFSCNISCCFLFNAAWFLASF